MNPVENGWKIQGESSLYNWSPEEGRLHAIWDSSKPNTFFYRELDQPVTESDSFSFGFTFHVDTIRGGVDPSKPGSQQLSIGLIQTDLAFGPGYLRGTGADSPNLLEFNYFPDTGFGATVSPVVISKQHEFAAAFEFPVEMRDGSSYEIQMDYVGETRTLSTQLLEDGTNPIPVQDVVLPDSFAGFSLNALAVCSYSDAGQSPPEFAGSILASGWLDDIRMESLAVEGFLIRPVMSDGFPTLSLDTEAGKTYQLHRSTDLKDWSALDVHHNALESGTILLKDPHPPSGPVFYRVSRSASQ